MIQQKLPTERRYPLLTRKRICEMVIEYIETLSSDQAKILRYLAQINADDTEDKVSEDSINAAVFKGKKRPGAIRQEILRLGKNIDQFYVDHAGRREDKRIYIKPRSYALVFTRWQAPKSGVDHFEKFWGGYLNSEMPPLIIYPEPQFYRHKGTYVRNPRGLQALREDIEGVGEDLTLSFSFVPSGIISAMLLILGNLKREDHSIFTAKVRPAEQPSSDSKNHLIVLMTHTAHGTSEVEPYTNHILRDWPMGYLGEYNATYVRHKRPNSKRKIKIYRDENVTEHEQNIQKFALLTRRVDRGRIITMLSGWHGRSVQALADILTSAVTTERKESTEDLQSIMTALRSDENYPEEFQCLFGLDMWVSHGEPHTTRVWLEDVYVNVPAARRRAAGK